MRDIKVVVLGAGLSGLVSCIELERAGYSPTLIDKNQEIGGRLSTEMVNGLPLDLGFQVLLTEYPIVKEYLNLENLNLKQFLPGSYIHSKEKKTLWGDPTRNVKFLFPLLFSSLGTITDKLKINTLQKSLKKKSIEDIFNSPESRTIEYLREYGFSKKIILHFFQPFFTGIFLEEELNTSSRMFEFVFKLFAEGNATIPSKGMNEIAQQLGAQLTQTTILLGEKATITDHTVHLEDGNKIEFDYAICTFPKESEQVEWKSCENLYFTTDTNPINSPIIGLFTHENRFINNYHFVNDILEGEQNVVSVTVVKKHHLKDTELVSGVSQELEKYLGLKNVSLLRHYKIPHALPQLKDLTYAPKELTYQDNVIYTGDYTVQASINSAMLSGKKAVDDLLLLISKH